MKNWKKLVIAIIICQLAGVIGSFFTAPAIGSWYVFLQKPSFSPPNWIFAPVWTTLYTLMGISLYLVWKKGLEKREIKSAFVLFIIHLFLNSLWSILFFGVKNIQLAFFEIVILLVLVFYIITRFYRIDKKAAYLLIPYFLWISFATFLNYSLMLLN